MRSLKKKEKITRKLKLNLKNLKKINDLDALFYEFYWVCSS